MICTRAGYFEKGAPDLLDGLMHNVVRNTLCRCFDSMEGGVTRALSALPPGLWSSLILSV